MGLGNCGLTCQAGAALKFFGKFDGCSQTSVLVLSMHAEDQYGKRVLRAELPAS